MPTHRAFIFYLYSSLFDYPTWDIFSHLVFLAFCAGEFTPYLTAAVAKKNVSRFLEEREPICSKHTPLQILHFPPLFNI